MDDSGISERCLHLLLRNELMSHVRGLVMSPLYHNAYYYVVRLTHDLYEIREALRRAPQG